MSRAFAWPYSGSLTSVALLGLTVPATPGWAQGLAVYARTPTGMAETLFDTGPAGAAEKVADQCLAEGLELVAKDEAAVTCRLPDDREAGARLELGRAGRTGTPIFYRFQVEERGDAARVLADGWEETAGFRGGTQERGLNDPAFHNAFIDLMVEAGGRLPPGTRFPNHAMIGADSIARERPEQSLEVMAVEADSSAMRAGLQVGDLVTRIAGRRTRTLKDLNRSLVEAASAAGFEIRFLREGREGVALLRSEFRPPVTAPMLTEADEAVAEEPALKLPARKAASIASAPAVIQPAAVVPMPQAQVPPIMVPQAYAGPGYPAAAVVAPPGVPLTYAVPQPYGAAPHTLPQGAIMPVAAPSPSPATPSPSPATPSPAPAVSDFSVADELAKFANLLKEGVITQAEFDAQKARLLAQ